MGALTQQDQQIGSAGVTAASLIGLAAGGPLGAAIAGGIASIGVALANIFSGCGQSCTQATAYANQVGDLLTQNLNTYMSAPVHYASLQAAALQNYDSAWNWLVSACQNPSLGAAGQRCISDRARGSCAYQVAAGGGWQQQGGKWVFVPYGANGSGSSCWNWFIGLRDPIANDPTVVADPSPVASASSSILSDFGVNATETIGGIPVSDLLLPAALIAAGLLL